MRMARGFASVLVVVGLLPAVAAAGPRFSVGVGPYVYSTSDSYGMQVAFDASGDIFMAGKMGGCLGGLIFRFDRGLALIQSDSYAWTACMAEDPRGIAVGGSAFYVAVAGGAHLVKYTKAFVYQWNLVLSGSDTVYDVALDPVDGTLWVLGGWAMTPSYAKLYHVRDNGGSAEVLSSQEVRHGATEALGYSLAVTATRVYLAGKSYSFEAFRWFAWLVCWNRADGALLWSYRDTTSTMPKNVYREVAAGPEGLWTAYVQDDAANYTTRIMAHDPATGAPLGSGDIIYNTGAPMSDWDYAGRIAAHPSLPIAVGASPNTMFQYNARGARMPVWSGGEAVVIEPGAANVKVGGLAVSEGLDYTVAAAYTTGWMPYNARVAAWRFRSEVPAKDDANQLVVAPNVYDLSRGDAYVRIVARGEAAKPVTVRVFDSAGNLLVARELTVDAGGTVEWKWDGRMEDGSRIGAGSYVVVASGEGMKATSRQGFLVKPPKAAK